MRYFIIALLFLSFSSVAGFRFSSIVDLKVRISDSDLVLSEKSYTTPRSQLTTINHSESDYELNFDLDEDVVSFFSDKFGYCSMNFDITKVSSCVTSDGQKVVINSRLSNLPTIGF